MSEITAESQVLLIEHDFYRFSCGRHQRNRETAPHWNAWLASVNGPASKAKVIRQLFRWQGLPDLAAVHLIRSTLAERLPIYRQCARLTWQECALVHAAYETAGADAAAGTLVTIDVCRVL